MQSVTSAFTAEEKDSVRKIAHDLMISWKRESTLSNRTFTIGVSTIGGNDVIGANPGAIGSAGNYRYFEETEYVMSMAWERGLPMPVGGLSKAMAEVQLDNTSGRYTPRHMGGSGELFTAILPRRPLFLSAGFEVDGVWINIPQFAGILDRQPEVDARSKSVRLHAVDYIDFFQNRFLDQNVMFTGLRTDEVLDNLFQQQGMSTAQYDLDYGINIIPFGLFPSGTKFSEAINKLVEAENGRFYQDEEGVFRFENRQHWDSSPHDAVQKLLLTGQVLEAYAPDDDHIVNVVEVKGEPRGKQANQLVWQSSGFAGSGTVTIGASDTYELWVAFDDPMLEVDTPVANGTASQTSYYAFNTEEDGGGTDVTGQVSIKSIDKFATAAKITFQNNYTQDVFMTALYIWGRPARRTGDVYYRSQRGLSLTAYDERPLVIENEFIQSQSWAQSYGEMIIQDFAFPENLQRIVIRAIPELQLGDLVSWQGRHWRIYEKRTKLSPSEGFVDELTLLQREITTYFRIGISTIGGSDKIAP